MIETTEKPARRRRPGGGRKTKGGTRFARQVRVPLHAEDDDSLAAFARVDSEAAGAAVTKQDLIRAAIRDYLINRQIV